MSEQHDQQQPAGITRRAFLRASLAVPPALLLAACSGEQQATSVPTAAQSQPTSAPTNAPATAAAGAIAAPTQQGVPPPTQIPAPDGEALLPPTPSCEDDDDEPTISQTEGPFFTPNSPQRTSLLEQGIAGTAMVLTGYVLRPNCQPVAGALVDFWHADNAGEYDNVGYKLRGHQFTDEAGRFRLETIMPGLYPGRTRHFHVKVQAANERVLTTQLYFPGEPDNDSDGIFSPELLMEVQDSHRGPQATFNFVLEG